MKIRELGFLFLLIAATTACDDLRMYEVYDDTEQATAHGAFARGWLPEWIPASATNIHEHHDLDTNEQAISFEVAEVDSFSWPTVCQAGVSATAPRLKTKLFPTSVDIFKDVRNCGGLFTAIDENGVVHAWGKQDLP